MQNTEIIKLKRGNMLSRLWDDIFAARFQKMKTPYSTMGHLGQHTNPTRQAKNRLMRELGLTTGKQYRKYIKRKRRTIQ